MWILSCEMRCKLACKAHLTGQKDERSSYQFSLPRDEFFRTPREASFEQPAAHFHEYPVAHGSERRPIQATRTCKY